MEKIDKVKFMLPLFQFNPFWINASEELVEALYQYALTYSKTEEKTALQQSLTDIQARLTAIEAAK